MEKHIKNKIIAISGEPVSGKGTTVKAIIAKLKEQGYSKENIHLRTTGDEFRRFFNTIIDFIKHIDSPEKLKEIGKSKELQKILQNKEYREILEKTIAQIKNSNIDLSNFNISDANKSPEFSEIRRVVDTLIDEETKELGIKINEEERPNEVWIVDSRLAFDNIQSAFSVRLTTNPTVAAQRLFNDSSRGKEDKYSSIEEAKEEREERRISEIERYIKRYGVNLENPENYDLIIDTSYSSVEDIADIILQCEECYRKGEEFAKNWASPKIFLPVQSEMQTFSAQPLSYGNLENLIEAIQKNGYMPSKEIKTVNVDGKYYIIEGHHRNFASVYAGKTLIPYNNIAKDDEKIPEYNFTARQRAEAITYSKLCGHEAMIESALNRNSKQNEKIHFSYNEIYPGIHEQIQRNEQQER